MKNYPDSRIPPAPPRPVVQSKIMNERMLDLVEESRDLVPTQTKVGNGMYIPGPIVRGDVNLQRFAELIVAECVRKIEDIAESSNTPQPIYRVAVELLEHFGVTE